MPQRVYPPGIPILSPEAEDDIPTAGDFIPIFARVIHAVRGFYPQFTKILSPTAGDVIPTTERFIHSFSGVIHSKAKIARLFPNGFVGAQREAKTKESPRIELRP